MKMKRKWLGEKYLCEGSEQTECRKCTVCKSVDGSREKHKCAECTEFKSVRGTAANDAKRTNVPDLRIAYRYNKLESELKLLLHAALGCKRSVAVQTKDVGETVKSPDKYISITILIKDKM